MRNRKARVRRRVLQRQRRGVGGAVPERIGRWIIRLPNSNRGIRLSRMFSTRVWNPIRALRGRLGKLTRASLAFVTGKTLKRSSGTPILQVPAETWNSEYNSGLWNRLTDIDELGHYAVLLGFLIYAQANRAILDVGCGKAVLLDYLRRSCGYERYVGIDVSEIAIR